MSEFEYGDRVVHPTLGEGEYRFISDYFPSKAWVSFVDHDWGNWIAVPTDRLTKVEPSKPEPAPGSIARHKSPSVAYVRPWGCGVDGDHNWASTDGYKSDRLKWDEIKDHVVVVVDVPPGATSYDNS